MAWVTPAPRATGYVVTAADWNELVNDLRYLKGLDGAVAIDNSLTVGGNLGVSGNVTVTGAVNASASMSSTGASSGYNVTARDDGTKNYVFYANAGQMHLFSGGYGNVLSFNYLGAGITWPDVIDNGIWPGRLHQSILAGFLRAGTFTYAYNGDNTIASKSVSGGPLNGWAVTFEYSSSRISATRLRSGGTGGSIVHSITYTYDGSNRVSTEAHS